MLCERGTGIIALPSALMAYGCLQVARGAPCVSNRATEATYVPRNICHALARYFVSQRDADTNRLLTIFVLDTVLWVTIDNEFNHGADALSECSRRRLWNSFYQLTYMFRQERRIQIIQSEIFICETFLEKKVMTFDVCHFDT